MGDDTYRQAHRVRPTMCARLEISGQNTKKMALEYGGTRSRIYKIRRLISIPIKGVGEWNLPLLTASSNQSDSLSALIDSEAAAFKVVDPVQRQKIKAAELTSRLASTTPVRQTLRI